MAYKSQARREGIIAPGPGGRAAKSSYDGARTNSYTRKGNSYNPAQTGKFGSRVHPSAASVGNIALGSEGPRKPPMRRDAPSESDKAWARRMMRHLGPDPIARGNPPRDKW